MKYVLHAFRLLVAVGCAAVIAYVTQQPRDFAVIGYAGVVAFVMLLTLGNLIYHLWELKIDSVFYRYVALPVYPIALIFTAISFFNELGLLLTPTVLLLSLVYLLVVTVLQKDWISFIGAIYRSQVTDHLLFPRKKSIETRDDLIIPELIVNGICGGCIAYLIIHFMQTK